MEQEPIPMKKRLFALTILLALSLALTGVVLAQEESDDTYVHPDGLFSVPIPTSWTAEQFDDYAVLASPEDGIVLYMLVIATDDGEAAVVEGWELVRPGFDPGDSTVQAFDGAMVAPLDQVVVVNYPPAEDKIYQGVAQIYDSISYVILVDANLVQLQQRAAQLNIVNTGFSIAALDDDDLSEAEPLPLTEEMIAELEAHIAEVMELMELPGLAIAVVQGDEVVYSNGFGVRELGGDDPVTAETLMMIGSTTKTMTTMAMGTLVDEGLMAWDTPVIELLPTFAVADPDITQSLTVENLVCACSGVPRRDFELIFNGDELTAEDIVESLATFEFFTDFGEAFQYSNQMVAMGGYAAALADGAEFGDLYNGYLALMQARIFDPIGMSSTTFSFAEAAAYSDLALPHGVNLDLEYYPLSLDAEAFLSPIAPAGAAWSNVEDMAGYLITAMNMGVTQDGTRVISEENLLKTWEPQVSYAAEGSYGLGWMIDKYRGLDLLHHGGNTLGFTSDMTILPGADLGLTILINAQGANAGANSIGTRLIELLYDLEPLSAAALQGQVEATHAQLAEIVFSEEIDIEAVTPFLGDYHNDALGGITLLLEDGALWIDAGEFVTEVRAELNDDGESENYISYDMPLAGTAVHLREVDGERRIVVGSGVVEYTFTAVE
jgi:CubicO group peptidase (beta-lactamase class C family)